MSIPKFNPRTIVLLLIVALMAIVRLSTNFVSGLSPIAVFSPLGAMALFGGAYFQGAVKPFSFPLLTLFISDLILMNTVDANYRSGLLYQGWYWTYGAFALMTIAGKLIVKDVTIKSMIIAVLVVTIIHWLVSDIGACLTQPTASQMITLYGERLITAIPFELRFLAGTAVYSAIFFGSFEWMQKRFPALHIA